MDVVRPSDSRMGYRKSSRPQQDDEALALAGGPLALRVETSSSPALATLRPVPVPDGGRLLVGRTAEDWPIVCLDLGGRCPGGLEVRLVAGARGLEATFLVSTAAARRAVESQLGEMARALESRGLGVARCQVSERRRRGREER